MEAVFGSDSALTSRGGAKKTLKLLSRLRRRAGKVRDLDVQIRLLRGLKMPEETRRKSELLRLLTDERAQRDQKLRKTFSRDVIAELRKHLKRVCRKIDDGWDPAQEAFLSATQLAQIVGPITEQTLHQYRILGKRVRYLAELAEDNPEAVRMVDILRKMQDVIGDWHDWLKLTERAEEQFGTPRDSHLVAALRNITQAKYRQSLVAVEEARSELGTPAIPSRNASSDRIARATSVAAA